jgi:hypothetical protein
MKNGRNRKKRKTTVAATGCSPGMEKILDIVRISTGSHSVEN